MAPVAALPEEPLIEEGPGTSGQAFRPLRPYLAVVMGLLSIGGAAMAVARGLGWTERTSLRSYAGAAALGAVGLAAWSLVAARIRRGSPSPLAWAAFPISLFALLGMLPLLCVAVFPGVLDSLGAPDWIEVRRWGDELRIQFPRRMEGGAINLELNGQPVPGDYFRKNPGRAVWEHRGGARDRSALTLDLRGMSGDLGLGPVHTVGLNQVPGAPQMLDGEGERFQPQTFHVPEPGGAGPR